MQSAFLSQRGQPPVCCSGRLCEPPMVESRHLFQLPTRPHHSPARPGRTDLRVERQAKLLSRQSHRDKTRRLATSNVEQSEQRSPADLSLLFGACAGRFATARHSRGEQSKPANLWLVDSIPDHGQLVALFVRQPHQLLVLLLPHHHHKIIIHSKNKNHSFYIKLNN